MKVNFKPYRYRIVILFIVGMLAGCSNKGVQETAEPETSAEETAEPEKPAEETAETEKVQKTASDRPRKNPIAELLQDAYEDYQETGGEIAFVSNGTVEDGSYNEAIYRGIRIYALSAGVSFSAYAAEEETSSGYRETIERVIENHARIIVCTGDIFGEAVGELQEIHPEVAFLLLDEGPVDESGESIAMADNVHCISFHEEESGYLAGYLTVLEGYRRLGFIGGESVPSVIRYGYGFLQGIDDAAIEMGAEDVTVRYWYAETFEPDSAVTEKASEWYSGGTEIIFACGGFLYKAVLEAADREDGLLIGVDVDQSEISERFLTSAVKGISNAVVIALDDFYASGMHWSKEAAGQEVKYGVQDSCTGLPVVNAEWKFKNVSIEDYYRIYKKIRLGEILISDETGVCPEVSFTVNFDEAGE